MPQCPFVNCHTNVTVGAIQGGDWWGCYLYILVLVAYRETLSPDRIAGSPRSSKTNATPLNSIDAVLKSSLSRTATPIPICISYRKKYVWMPSSRQQRETDAWVIAR